jgi:dipeptidyl aminopeptidase/acylaminoacyl peptidase
MRLADSTLHRVALEGAAPRWDAAGRHLYYLAGPAGAVDLWRVRIDEQTGQALGAPDRMLSVPRARLFDVGPAGQLVTQEVTSTLHARVASVTSGVPPRLTDERDLPVGSASVGQTVISDDGKVVAIARELSGTALVPAQGRTSRRFVVELMPFAGGVARPVPPASVSQFAPQWAPDGRRLTVLRADSSGDFVTLVSTADGAARRLGTRPAVGMFRSWGDAVWSADGSRVIYLVSSRELVIVDPERLTETTIAIPDSIGTAFMGQVLSPHGDEVAVSTIHRLTDWAELWVVDVASRRWHRAVEPFGNSVPLRWTTDGTIYVQSDRAIIGESGNGLTDVWAVQTDGSRPRFVAPLPEGCAATSISADGRRVACALDRVVSDILLATDFVPPRN